MNPIRWLKEKLAQRRWRKRQDDVENLFQLLWKLAEHDPVKFIMLVGEPIASNPAWDYPDEWRNSDQNPGRWAARKLKEKQQ